MFGVVLVITNLFEDFLTFVKLIQNVDICAHWARINESILAKITILYACKPKLLLLFSSLALYVFPSNYACT